MLNLLPLALLPLVATQAVVNVAWPNSFPKQLVAIRRRSGLTNAEYLYHHTIVHGRKTWNAPDSVDQPLAYVQDHVFDSAYGINSTVNTPEPSYFGHSNVAELYSRSENAYRTPPPNNYTATVIGPDGNFFADFSAAISMFAYEKFEKVKSTCSSPISKDISFNAFYWIFANATNAGSSSFNNATFAAPIMQSLLAAFPPNTIYNASLHIPVADLDSRRYYGGYGNPPLNAALKFWLCNDNTAVINFRKAQLSLIAQKDQLMTRLDQNFVSFTKSVLMYDRSTGTPFDTARAYKTLIADQYRGDVSVPP